jgi:uncharacterized repeat protein (TIGR01451 family)
VARVEHAGARLLVGLGVVLTLFWVNAGLARAEGSAQLYPANATCTANSAGGSCRANIEWRTDAYGPASGAQVRRRSYFQVYAQAGEVLEMGSSAVGVGAGDVLVFDPGVVTDTNAQPLPTISTGVSGFRCSDQRTASGNAAQGVIASRAEELSGPQSADGTGNLAGYVPCTYVAPTTGIYGVVFYGPSGDGSAVDGGPTGEINLTSAANFGAAQGTSVAAWDLTVRSSASSTSDLAGRLFTTALIAFTGSNARPINVSVDVVTLDGYRYRTDTRGLDPNGFAFYGNEEGFYDGDGTSPLYHDAIGTTSSSELTGLAGGVTFAAPQYPIFLGSPAAATLTALGIPLAPAAPTMTGFSFTGNISGNTSSLGGGGTFSFDAGVPGVYEIVISRDGVNFDPGASQNRVLRGVVTTGSRSVTWDGKDNSGADFPVGSGYAVHAALHAGEYHFPLIDAENSTLGGPTFTLLNPPGGSCPLGSCSTAFFDDRGYHTDGPAAAAVGTPSPPDTPQCGSLPPAAPHHSDPVSGYDSSSTARAFGADSGGNTNVPCTGSFGDVKGLDTWTYFPSAATANSLNIVSSADVSIVTSHAGSFTVGQNGTFGLLVGNAGPFPSGAVTVTDVLPAGLSLVSGAGAGWTCGAVGQTVTCTNATGVASGGSSTIALAVAVGPAAAPSVTNTATAAGSIPDQNASNGSSSDVVSVIPIPLAVDDNASTIAGAPVTVGVLGNDTAGVAPTAITSHTAPGHGGVSCAASSCTYTPAAGFTGADSFQYTITDANARTSTATVTVDVHPPSVSTPPGGSVVPPTDPTPTPPPATTPTPPRSDLQTSIAGPAATRHGQVVTLTAVVHNNGPDAAAGARASITLPVGLAVQPGSIVLAGAPPGSRCTATGTRVTCALGTVGAGAAVHISLRVRVGARAGPLLARANVTSTTLDTAPANNPSRHALRVIARHLTAAPARLGLRLTAEPDTTSPGGRVRLRVRVRNDGPGTATRVLVCLPAPATTAYVSIPGATLVRGSACWSIPAIGAGGTRTFTVVVRVDATVRDGRLHAKATLARSGAPVLTAHTSFRVHAQETTARQGGVTG